MGCLYVWATILPRLLGAHDPVQFLGRSLGVIGGLMALFGGLSTFAGETPEDRHFAFAVLLVGLMIVGLGVGTERESRVCATIGALLVTLCLLPFFRAGGLCVLTNLIVIGFCWKGVVDVFRYKQLDRVAAERQAAFASGREIVPGATSRFTSPLPAVPVRRPSEPTVAPEPSGQGPMLCSSCNRRYPEDRRRCVSCGAALTR